MGHYDDHYEQTEREDRARARQEASATAKELKIPVLGDSDWDKALGVCAKCARVVYVVPNFNCGQTVCPHKPPR